MVVIDPELDKQSEAYNQCFLLFQANLSLYMFIKGLLKKFCLSNYNVGTYCVIRAHFLRYLLLRRRINMYRNSTSAISNGSEKFNHDLTVVNERVGEPHRGAKVI